MLSSNDARINWQPNLNRVREVQKEIETKFSEGYKNDLNNPSIRTKPEKPDPLFIEQCAKVGAFLMDELAVLNQLQRLNQLLEDAKKKNKTKNPISLLREIIEKELSALGFQPQLGKALGEITPVNFRAAVAKGWLLKDPSLGAADHGELTHVIQWLLIAWQQKDSNFLGQPAINVFRHLGQDDSVFIRRVVRIKDSSELYIDERNIWDLIVDNTFRKDFRSPEILHNFLLQSTLAEISSLHSAITTRYQERLLGQKNKSYPIKNLPTLHTRKEGKEPYIEFAPKVLTTKGIDLDQDKSEDTDRKSNRVK